MKRMDVLKVSSKEYIEEKIIENLLNAHKRACEQENCKTILKLTRFIWKLAQMRKDKFLEIRPEENEHGTEKPPYEGE